MILTLTKDNFIEAFKRSSERKDQFSYNALCALFDYYEELEESTGEKVEFDMVAICCEWCEYETALEWAENYFTFSVSDIDNISMEDAEQEALRYLLDNTQVIHLKDGGIIITNF